jgi:hypothetical protein
VRIPHIAVLGVMALYIMVDQVLIDVSEEYATSSRLPENTVITEEDIISPYQKTSNLTSSKRSQRSRFITFDFLKVNQK